MSSPRSRIGAEWVIQPDEIRSTPAAAIAGAVSRVMRPEASVTARPATISTARRRVGGSMLSSSTASNAVVERLGELVERVDLELDLDEVAGMGARPFRAAPTPPASATWLSLISIASSRPKRWLAPPPSRTASFSRMRRPGVVLRVQTILALWPSIASASERVAVATPGQPGEQVERGALGRQHRPRPAGDAGDGLAALDTAAVGGKNLDVEGGIEQFERQQRRVEPGDDARLARRNERLDLRVGRHDRVGRDVAGAAEILGQRGADDRLDQQASMVLLAVRHAGLDLAISLMRHQIPGSSPRMTNQKTAI